MLAEGASTRERRERSRRHHSRTFSGKRQEDSPIAKQGAGVICADIDEKAVHSSFGTIQPPVGMVEPALFLASDMSHCITGITPVVDGGDGAV